MTIILFTKHWFARSVAALINAGHVGACDLFPHPGLLDIGGTQVFARSQLTRRLHFLIARIIKRVPRCGWPEPFTKDFVELWSIADGFITLIDQSTAESSEVANQAARYFYLICGGAWNLVSSFGQSYGVEPESSLAPFRKLLEQSGVGENWHDQNLHKTNEMLRSSLEKTRAKLLSLIHH